MENLIGMGLMRIVELLAIFVAVKAVVEAYKTNKVKLDTEMHKRLHIAVLIMIAVYNIYDVLSFIHFEAMNKTNVDYTISFFNLLASDLIGLLVVYHFKQERIDNYEKLTIKELFKF